jgi:hypothetical protein
MISLEAAQSENRDCPSIGATSGISAIQSQRLHSSACGNNYPCGL